MDEQESQIAAMAEQLGELYAEKETLNASFPGMSVSQIIETAVGVREQLLAIVEESFEDFLTLKSAMTNIFPGMSAQEILKFAQIGKETGHLSGPSVTDSASSLEAQLIELYAEKQALAEAFPDMSVEHIASDFENKIGKLERYYSVSA